MKHHMPHPFKHMSHMRHHGMMHHRKQQKRLSILTLAVLVALLAVNVMHMKEMMKRKKSGNIVQDKIEHFQRCFERLMEHS